QQVALYSLPERYNVFFSSRRRHTRSKRDWSSDVCSSDLLRGNSQITTGINFLQLNPFRLQIGKADAVVLKETFGKSKPVASVRRSEERRVGKECRAGWSKSGNKREMTTEA